MTTVYVAMDDEVLIASPEAGGWHVDLQLKGTQPFCLAADEKRPDQARYQYPCDDQNPRLARIAAVQ